MEVSWSYLKVKNKMGISILESLHFFLNQVEVLHEIKIWVPHHYQFRKIFSPYTLVNIVLFFLNVASSGISVMSKANLMPIMFQHFSV